MTRGRKEVYSIYTMSHCFLSKIKNIEANYLIKFFDKFFNPCLMRIVLTQLLADLSFLSLPVI